METHKLSEELIETVYLYAYKRVSNYEEARDLAQEIILEAFLETKRNRVQKDFYAWLWRMAHNKYVDFLRRKNSTDYQLDFDTDEEFITSNLNGWNSIEMDLINNEEIQNLYQSIELLSEVHRETIIRFNLRDQSISEISEALNIPEGTVKRRLFDAREQMRKFMTDENKKENIEVKAVFDPFETDLTFCGNAYPAMMACREKFESQIAVACYRESKTREELGKEIHVDPSYLEDTIKVMLDVGTLKETEEGKLQTDYNLIPSQIWTTWWLAKRKILEEKNTCRKIYDYLFSLKEDFKKSSYNLGDFSFEYLLWDLIGFVGDVSGELIDELIHETYKKETGDFSYQGKDFSVFGQYFPRSWAVPATGEREIDSEDIIGFSERGANFYHNYFYEPVYPFCRLHMLDPWLDEPNRDPAFSKGRTGLINQSNYGLFYDIVTESDFEPAPGDEEKIALLLKENVLKKTDGKLKVNFPVFSKESYYKYRFWIKEALRPLIREVFDSLISEMQRILLPNIRKDLVPMFLNQNMYNVFLIRTNFFDWCCKNKLVETPEDFGSYTGGLSLVFEEPTKISLEDGICSIGENQFKAKYIGKSDKTWEAACDHLDFWILEDAWEKLCHNQRGKDMIGEFVFPEPLKPETVYAVRFVNKDGSTSLGFYTQSEEEPVSFPGMQPSKMAQKIFV